MVLLALFTALSLLVCSLVVLVISSYISWRRSPLRKVPGPPATSFWVGHFQTIMKEPFLQPHQRWWKQALVLEQQQQGSRSQDGSSSSSIPIIAYSLLLGRYSITVLDCDLVQQILLSQSSRDPVRYPKNYLLLKESIGLGLVTLEGSVWSRHRRIIQPSFHSSIVRKALSEAVPHHTATLVRAWNMAAAGAGSREIDVASHLSALTLDIIGGTAFAHEFQATSGLAEWATAAAQESENGDNNNVNAVKDPLIMALMGSLHPGPIGIVLAILKVPWMIKYVSRRARRVRKAMNDAVDDVIVQARKNKAQTNNTASNNSNNNISCTNMQQSSLLQLLFDAKDAESRSSLTDLELRDEVKTFIAAGHETTSTWCYWALYALAKFPDVQERVYQDIHKHARGDSGGNHATEQQQPLDLESIEKMEYLNAFLNEVLRLYPPVGMIVRYTSQPEVFKGYTIPAKTRMLIPIHLLHRHPDHWKQPTEFRPERWLEAKECASRHRFCFLPFSAGGRNCVGQRFAQMEVKLILAPIVQAFTIQLAPSIRDKDITFTSFATMKARPGIKICVKAR